MATGMSMHDVDILDTKTSGKDSDLNLLAKLRVSGESPLDFEVTKLSHKVVDVVHLFHHQTVLAILLSAEGDREQNLFGIEHVVVVEQRRVESIVDSLLHASLTFAVSC